MTPKEKEILLKDLCGRLPYEIKGKTTAGEVTSLIRRGKTDYDVLTSLNIIIEKHGWRPYLFPLSSMTEIQYESLKESGILDNCSHSYEYINSHIHGVSFIFKEFKTYSLELIDWLNKNKFDYRGLIPMGLALNATGLSIY